MKQEIDEINILKGIGILAVMLGHSMMFLLLKELPTLNIYIYAFHMPLFFMISGFFLKESCSKSEILKVLKRLYIPFLLFLIFNSLLVPFLVQLPTYIRSSDLYPIQYDLLEQLLKLAKGIFLGRREDILGTGLWFLLALTLAKIMWIFLNGKLKLKSNIQFILFLFIINISLYYALKDKSLFYQMWPIVILAYFLMNIGKYYYEKNLQAKLSNLDIVILFILSSALIIINGRVDMSSYGLHNIILFIFNALMSLFILHRLSQIIDKQSILIKRFLIFSGKHSLAILLVHPFFLAIIPYILMANFNIKNIYDDSFWLIVIYFIVFVTVYGFDRSKNKILIQFNKKTS